MVSRDKNRAYVNKYNPADQARGNKLGRILTKAYSGFVHASSPHIMDMCAGHAPLFDISGQHKTFRRPTFERDAMNYFFRGILAMGIAARAFGDDELFELMRVEAQKF
jgi:hypothetical protein